MLFQEQIEKLWYSKHPIGYLLIPLSWIYILVIKTRRLFYQIGLFNINQLDVPVIVVGNISVGGTGKTPSCCGYVSIFGIKV